MIFLLFFSLTDAKVQFLDVSDKFAQKKRNYFNVLKNINATTDKNVAIKYGALGKYIGVSSVVKYRNVLVIIRGANIVARLFILAIVP